MKTFIIFKISWKNSTWFPDGPEWPEDCIVKMFEPCGTAFAPSATAAVKCFGSRCDFKAVEAEE